MWNHSPCLLLLYLTRGNVAFLFITPNVEYSACSIAIYPYDVVYLISPSLFLASKKYFISRIPLIRAMSILAAIVIIVIIFETLLKKVSGIFHIAFDLFFKFHTYL